MSIAQSTLIVIQCQCFHSSRQVQINLKKKASTNQRSSSTSSFFLLKKRYFRFLKIFCTTSTRGDFFPKETAISLVHDQCRQERCRFIVYRKKKLQFSVIMVYQFFPLPKQTYTSIDRLYRRVQAAVKLSDSSIITTSSLFNASSRTY